MKIITLSQSYLSTTIITLLVFTLLCLGPRKTKKQELSERHFAAMAASLQSSATFLQSTKLSTAPSRGSALLRSTQTVGKSFGLETSSARLTCSYQSDIKDFAGKFSDAVKISGFALATSALVVSVTNFVLSPTLLYHLFIDKVHYDHSN